MQEHIQNSHLLGVDAFPTDDMPNFWQSKTICHTASSNAQFFQKWLRWFPPSTRILEQPWCSAVRIVIATCCSGIIMPREKTYGYHVLPACPKYWISGQVFL